MLDPTPRSLELASDWSRAAELDRDGLKNTVQALRSHMVLVVFVVLGTLGGALAWLALRPVDYSARAELMVTPVDSADRALLGLPLIRDLGDPARTMETAAAVVETRQNASVAARRLGPEWTPQRLADAVEVRPRGQTNILEIVGKGASPETAARVATVFAQTVVSERARSLRLQTEKAIADLRAQLAAVQRPTTVPALEDRLDALELLSKTGDPSVTLAQPAALPTSPSGPPAPMVLGLALIAAGVLSTGAAALLERLAPGPVASERELAPLPVLARVPRLRARRRRPTPANPTPDPAVSEAFRAVRAQLDLLQPSPRTIMITSPERGDGRTICALNLAVELARAGRKVLLVDLDRAKRDLTATLEEFSPGRFDHPDDRLRMTSLAQLDSGQSLRMLEPRSLPNLAQSDNTRLLPDFFARATQGVDFVLVDTPPLSEPADSLPLLVHADAVVVVARNGHTTRAAIEAVPEVLARARQRTIGCVFIGARR